MSNELKKDYEDFLRKLMDSAKSIRFFTKKGIWEIEDSLDAFRRTHLSVDSHKNNLMLHLIEGLHVQDAEEVEYVAFRLLRAEIS